MSARVDADSQAGSQAGALPAGQAPALPPIALDPDDMLGNALPSDHPAWMKDTLSLSQRARLLFTRLKPAVVTVLRFWDHHVRSIVVGGRRLSIDASGSYRVD
ncbi:MAG: hypothetical protein WAJ85_14735 [Candidatus Baltobacteraceae bacterium]|jgi:hypothetical protein